MIPFRTPFLLPLLYPSLLWRGDPSKKEIFLTFDDGPVQGPTEFVLDELMRTSTPATFFCIGDNVRKHPAVFDRLLSEGHVAANHTYHHVNGWRTDTARYFEEVLQCRRAMEQHTVHHDGARLFRPPYGKITRQQIRVLSDYRIVMWDVLTKDYDHALVPDQCLRKSIASTRNGSIVVFHDSVKAERNMTFVLPRYIEHFRSLGFQFKSIAG